MHQISRGLNKVIFPQVSVVMPVYNGEKFLREAIDSILSQTFQDFELIIIDDNSTDGTVSIVTSYNDRRIRFHSSSQRLKLAGALNLGIEKAQGTYLARMDADDICEPERLGQQHAFLEQNKHIGICGTWTNLFPVPEQHLEKYPLTTDEVQALSLFHSPFAHPSVMIRKEVLTSNHLKYDVDYYPTEDFDLWCRALKFTQGANLNEALLRYRLHPDSLTRTDWSLMDEQAARITLKSLQELGITENMDQARYHRKVAMVRVECEPLQLQKTGAWLETIRDANDKKCIYPTKALHTVLDFLWFSNCMHCAPKGLWAAKCYVNRRFNVPVTTSMHRTLLLIGSFLRHLIVK